MRAESLDLIGAHGRSDALLHAEGTGVLPAGAVRTEVVRWERLLAGPVKMLVRVDRPREPEQLFAYLAALRLGHSVLPVDGASRTQAEQFDEAFRPDLVVTAGTLRPGSRRAEDPPPHPELGLLLPTSGSSGRPRAVRLSYANLRANGEAIAAATAITTAERVATSLPMDFALGLSLAHSHLLAGASVALGTANPVTRRFWYHAGVAAATTVGLVPAAVHTLLAWRWAADPGGSLRRLLVAGGPLDAAAARTLADVLEPAGAELWCMYGQAEATARISCLPPHLLRTHSGSVGHVVPGHRVRILAGEDGRGEIEYSGPSVMMGYGRDRADLALGDVQGRSLRTGDLGRLTDGLLYVDGRIDRQVKVLGRRVDLGAVEAAASTGGGTVAAVAVGADRLLLLVEEVAGQDVEVRARAAERAGLPVACVALRRVAALPRTGSGKIAYGELAALLPAAGGS